MVRGRLPETMFRDIFGHEDIKKTLLAIKDNLPLSIIFFGPKNVGKKYTAYNFIDEIYGGLFSTRLKIHPDILFFEPEKEIFKLDLIQEIQKTILFTPSEIDKKFYILKNVDKMNKSSSNSCL